MDYRQKLRERLGLFMGEEDFSDEIEDQELEVDESIEDDLEAAIDVDELPEDGEGDILEDLSDRLEQGFLEDEHEGMEDPLSVDDEEEYGDDSEMVGDIEGEGGMEITPEQEKLSQSQRVAEQMLDKIMKPIRKEANRIEESDINNGMMLRKFYEYVYTNKEKIASFMSKGIK